MPNSKVKSVFISINSFMLQITLKVLICKLKTHNNNMQDRKTVQICNFQAFCIMNNLHTTFRLRIIAEN